MPQTERDMATIFGLLADNVTGDISPQDMRDAIASLMGYGGIFLTSGGSGTINGVGTGYALIDVFDTISAQSNTVNTGGVSAQLAPNYRLTVGSAGVYRIAFYASLSSSQANRLITIREHKNGNLDTLEVSRWVSASDTGAVAFEGIESLNANDVIDMRVRINTGTTNLTFTAAALTLHRVG